jgi:hypothetical protein
VTVIIVTVLFLDIATPLAIKWWSKEYKDEISKMKKLKKKTKK